MAALQADRGILRAPLEEDCQNIIGEAVAVLELNLFSAPRSSLILSLLLCLVDSTIRQ
jgi:hypothetical protein